MFDGIFVARQTVHRYRGKAHDATIKQTREIERDLPVCGPSSARIQ